MPRCYTTLDQMVDFASALLFFTSYEVLSERENEVTAILYPLIEGNSRGVVRSFQIRGVQRRQCARYHHGRLCHHVIKSRG